jgi:hypothetical protein
LACSARIRAERLAASLFAPGVVLARRRVVLRLLRRCADLGGELVGQIPVTLVELGPDLRVLAKGWWS